jgi:hypothetical protein
MADVLVLGPWVAGLEKGTGPGKWLALMPVDVFEDGQLGPGSQQHPSFFVVRIPGVPKADVEDLLAMVEVGDTLIKRRDYSVDWGTLSNPIRRQIEDDREITVDESLFRSVLARATETQPMTMVAVREQEEVLGAELAAPIEVEIARVQRRKRWTIAAVVAVVVAVLLTVVLL